MNTGGMFADPGQDWAPGDGDQAASRLADLKSRLLSTTTLDKVPQPEPLIDGTLYLNSMAWLSGQRSSCKSFGSLGMAGSVGTGLPWMGQNTRIGRVLYLVGEGLPGIRKRVRAWEEYHATDMVNVDFLPGPMHLVGDQAAIAKIAVESSAVLVICDTQATLTVGMDETSSRDMGQIVAALDYIREVSKACVLSVHHEAINGDRPRGHSVMDGAATTMLRFVKDGDMIWVANSKQKDEAQAATMGLGIKLVADSLVLLRADQIPGGVTAASQITVFKTLQDMCNVEGGAAATKLREAVESRGVPKATYYWAVKQLLKAGLIINTGKPPRTWYQVRDPAQQTFDDQRGV